MSNIFENMKKVFELISSSILALATVYILAGIILLFLGFLKLDGSKIVSRDITSFPPVILGAVLSTAGLLLFVREYSQSNNKKVKNIVFYSPTIKANSFFIELLDYSVELAKQKGYNFIIEKGDLEQYHAATNYLDVIRKYSGSKASNTVLIMIPPSPSAYRDIWNLPKDLAVNLITLDLDIEIEGQENKFYVSPFHKRVILVDNRLGTTLAAEEIISFCKTENIQALNIIICEGDFHARGQLFKTDIERLVRNSNLEVCFLGEIEKLSFSDAVKKARNYINYVLGRSTEDLKKRDTFIFCANDSLAIGARMEVSHFSSGAEESFKPIRIICFDASTIVKIHIDHGDKFFWCAIDQRYTEIVRQAFESAELLFEGKNLENEVIKIKPSIHKRYKRR